MKKKIGFIVLIVFIFLVLWQFPTIYKLVISQQKHMIQEMKHIIREKENGVFGLLLGITFFYGFIHSLGPGHGKSFLMSYVLKSKVSKGKLLMMTAMIAYLQAFLAYLFVHFVLDLASQSSMLELYTIDQKTRLLSAIMIVLIAFFDFVLLFRKKEESPKECWIFAGIVGLCPCPGVMSILLFLNLLGYEAYAKVFAFSTASGIFCMLTLFSLTAGSLKEYLTKESSPKLFSLLHIIGMIALLGIGLSQIYFSI